MSDARQPSPNPPVRSYRGSRKHVLDWVSQPAFTDELLAMVQPVECTLRPETGICPSVWMPRGASASTEARLERFGPRVMPGHPAWVELTAWWLAHPRGANTPNWDIAMNCDIDGQHGLVLIEAKANVPELSPAGKAEPARRRLPDGLTAPPSAASLANHERIGAAIEGARAARSATIPTIAISCDHSYQLSNRIAFAWKLATLGIPVVLVYLSFTKDAGISDVGAPFEDEEHWYRCFTGHAGSIGLQIPDTCSLQLVPKKLWILARARQVLSPSPTSVATRMKRATAAVLHEP